LLGILQTPRHGRWDGQLSVESLDRVKEIPKICGGHQLFVAWGENGP
jgi:hypothetical protein